MITLNVYVDYGQPCNSGIEPDGDFFQVTGPTLQHCLGETVAAMRELGYIGPHDDVPIDTLTSDRQRIAQEEPENLNPSYVTNLWHLFLNV